MARFEMNGRDSGRIVRFSGWRAGSDDDDDVFGFSDFADGTSSSDGSCSSGEWVAGEYAGHEIEDDDEDANSANVEEQRAFWASQEQLVLATLYRTSSLETKVRHATKQALKDAQRLLNGGCSCSASSAAGSSCRSCLRSYISDQLRTQGFHASICKSKWRSSSEILSGEHTYLQVTDDSNPMRGEIRVIIELGFRVEFEMLKGGKEYTELVSKLPEVFVGKSERLQGLVKILCKAANKCMKDRNMHVGPWRKERYMLAKWFGACERIKGQFPVPAYEASRRPMKPRISLLSFDVFERCQEVRAV